MISTVRILACKSSISELMKSLLWLLSKSDHRSQPSSPPRGCYGWGTFLLDLLGGAALMLLLIAALYAPEVLR